MATQAKHRRLTGLARLIALLAVIALLLAVFSLYTQPAFLITLADQLWACF